MTDRTPPHEQLERARVATLAEHGAGTVIAHAHALIRRAWLPFDRYLSVPLIEYDPGPAQNTTDAASLLAVDVLGSVTADSDPPPRLRGELRRLPRTAQDPKGMQRHPDLVALATALASCLPAVFVALLDGAVPSDAGSASLYEARAALAQLHARYPDCDPALDPDPSGLIARTLLHPPRPNAPIEVTARWRWLAYVTDEDDKLRVADHMPFRCFERLADAQRYAVLHTDFSRMCVGGSRENTLFRQAIDAIAGCGADGVTVQAPNTMWKTVLVPNDLAPVPVRLPSP